MDPNLETALRKIKDGNAATLIAIEIDALYSAARAKSPKRSAQRITKERAPRAKFSAEQLDMHDTLEAVYQGLRELGLHDEVAESVVDVLIPVKRGWNTEQAQAVFAEVEEAIAESQGM